jgi:perosamine synthetase
MKNKFIPLSSPDITEKEIKSVVNVLRTTRLSLGPKLFEFEQKFAEYIGSKHAIAVNSGTSGLHLSIKSLGIGEKDAVITTPFSFIASANCMLYERALPLFVDIHPKTFNIDPDRIEKLLKKKCKREKKTGIPVDRKTGRRIRAILPVHVFGNPCEMDKIMDLAKEYNLHVIEDACEAIGAEFKGKKVGTFGDIGVFAFYPNKQITTGEGGMIVTNDEKIDHLCRSLRNQGRDGDGGWLEHSRLGYNYRISDINCALGIAQLERIEIILKKRKRVAFRYNELLRDYVKVPETSDGAKRSWFVYVVCLPDQYSKDFRDKTLVELSKKGIGCNKYFPPIHLQPFYRKMFGYAEGDFEVTEHVSERTIALPFHNNLKEEEILYVVDSLVSVLR